MNMKVSAIVPAYNEAERIAAVLEPLTKAECVGEIIVVDDGSTDETAHVAEKFPVKVIQLPRNSGKAAALDRGVREACNDVFLFLDADLVGLRPEHVVKLIRVYEETGADMVVGVFRSGRLNTDIAQTIAPYLSGQRVLSRRIWERLRESYDFSKKLEYGVEMALTKLSIKEDWHEERVELEGVTHVMKEEKRGLSQGLRERLQMYRSILRSLFSRVG
jgi:glycosyltransferase involved in cell wall biosynthesis